MAVATFLMITLAAASSVAIPAAQYFGYDHGEYPEHWDDVADKKYYGIQDVEGWPSVDLSLGQVAGVDVSRNNNVLALHRADRRWTSNTFDENWQYTEKSKGPISQPVIMILKDTNGAVLEKHGSNRFYLPHGLTVDSKDNVWITDVALHQVFKLSSGTYEPILTLGEQFTPGSDSTHFCAPTDVAVAENGQFFVSDGYCNSRIIKFSADGKIMKEWGHNPKGTTIPERYNLAVPHSLTLSERDDLLCVADREHKRIQCYNAGLKNESLTGEYYGTILDRNYGRIYAIAYDQTSLVMHAVTRQAKGGRYQDIGLTVDVTTGKLVDAWAPLQGFGAIHDLAVSHDGLNVYVADILYDRVWKFSRLP